MNQEIKSFRNKFEKAWNFKLIYSICPFNSVQHLDKPSQKIKVSTTFLYDNGNLKKREQNLSHSKKTHIIPH